MEKNSNFLPVSLSLSLIPLNKPLRLLRYPLSHRWALLLAHPFVQTILKSSAREGWRQPLTHQLSGTLQQLEFPGSGQAESLALPSHQILSTVVLHLFLLFPNLFLSPQAQSTTLLGWVPLTIIFFVFPFCPLDTPLILFFQQILITHLLCARHRDHKDEG